MTKTLNVMMYSPDSIGLGHVKRNSSIACRIVEQDPDANVILLVGSGAGAFFELPKGIDSIKLPSVDKVTSEVWRPRSLSLSQGTTSRLRSNLLREAIDTVEPDVLVIDHLPHGVWGELLPILAMIKSQGRPTKVMLGLRDILDTPDVVRRRWEHDGVYRTIEAYYDKVLIYGQPDIVPTAELYGLADRVPDRIEYCGYVYDSQGIAQQGTSVGAASKLPGLNALQKDQRVVFVQAGGGFDAYPMISATLSALRCLDDDETIRSIVVAGPLMPKADRDTLFAEAQGLKRTTLLPWTSNCDRYFGVADVAIIMGGYNSFLEATRSTAELISIPRSGPSAEQSIRAELFHQNGLATCIPLAEATPSALCGAILAGLSKRQSKRSPITLEGSRQAAKAIISAGAGYVAVPSHSEYLKGQASHAAF